MKGKAFAYSAGGLDMEGELFLPAGSSDPRPGVIVFPEGFGISDHSRMRAQRLAGLGYAALACDLHGQAKLYDDLVVVMTLLEALRGDPDQTRARASGAFEAFALLPAVDASRIAAIGYCFGGTMALELARSGADLCGIAGFHSGLATSRPEDAANIRGRVLVCLGADDPRIDAGQRNAFEDEMRAGGVQWEMMVFGKVVHSFTNPDADRLGRPDFARYDARADHRSWAALTELLGEVFAPPSDRVGASEAERQRR